MDYLCILNAFEQNYYNRVKEIERLAGAAAAATSTSPASSASPASSTASTSSASCLNGPSTSSTASSTASLPSTAREVAAALVASQRLTAYQGQGQGHGQGMIYHRQQMDQLEQLQQSHPLRPGSGTHQSQPASDPNSSNVANSLLWQPWRDFQQAAAMHHQLYRQQQQFHKEMRVTAKELPTTKWRRERRQRTAEYQVHDATSSDREREERDMDSPIDMSVSSGTLKHQLRASPPPPYREPLPGTNYAASRPSVITQAPPKREPPEPAHSSDVAMSDIDEHFRRSLGENYAALFSKKSPTPTPTPTPSPGVTPKQQVSPLAHGPPSVSCTAAPVASHLYQQHRSPLALPLHSPILRSRPESPQLELPPPQDEPLPLSLALHRNQTPPSPPPSATEAGPSLATADSEVMEPATPHHTPPRYNTPSPAYAANSVPVGSAGTPNLTRTPTPTPNPTATATPNPIHSTPSMPALIRVKAEPGLAAAAASSTQTPPASPTSSTNISIFTKTDASVDDHFAKALGDTWKKLQGGHKE